MLVLLFFALTETRILNSSQAPSIEDLFSGFKTLFAPTVYDLEGGFISLQREAVGWHILDSIVKIGTTFFAGMALATAAGIWTGRGEHTRVVRLLTKALAKGSVFFNQLPGIVVVIWCAWNGLLGIRAVLLYTTLIIFFQMWVIVHNAVKAESLTHILRAGQALGIGSKTALVLAIILPHPDMVHAIAGGMRLSLWSAFRTVFFMEYMLSRTGIGALMRDVLPIGATREFWALCALIAFLTYQADRLVDLYEKHGTPFWLFVFGCLARARHLSR
jgi:ABC-type nitrate/sulfonate/bicarbonate transport system permease component